MSCGLKLLVSAIIVLDELGEREMFARKKVGRSEKWAGCIGKK